MKLAVVISVAVSLDASNGAFLWLDNYTRYSRAVAPTVIAENGIFRIGATE
jgi:hypothetical protein